MNETQTKIAEAVLAIELAIECPNSGDSHGYINEQGSLFNSHNDPPNLSLCPGCNMKLMSHRSVDDLFDEGLSFTPTLGELCFCAKEGCAMCRFAAFMLLYHCRGFFRHVFRDGLDTRRALDIKLRGKPCKWVIRSFELTLFGMESQSLSFNDFIALAKDGNPANRFVVKSHRHYLDFAKSRMSECIKGHEDCRCGKDMPLPTRVLETSSEDGKSYLRLYETQGQQGQYSTLSYCWGGEQHYKLMSSRLEAYKDKIDESCLPKTIKDAIYITRQLGIRYLWIDAYCIIQDSAEDKFAEIRKMASIYKNSFLTIEASSASSSSAGFLSPDRRERLWPLPIRLPDTEYGTVLLRYDTNLLTARNMPIDKRAWTLQERYLSPRRISFPSDIANIIWECKQATLPDRGALRKPKYRQLPRINTKELSESDSTPVQRCMHRWTKILADYSKRALTVRADKLPAISAIAMEFHSFWGGEYFCGLWGRFLAPQLLWYCPEIPKDKSYWMSRHPYRAPSWSWASSDQPIKLRPHLYVRLQRLELLEVHIELIDPKNIFGRVKYASLRTRGLLKLVMLCGVEEYGYEKWEIRDIDGDKLTNSVYLDTRTYTTADGGAEFLTRKTRLEVWCLAVSLQEEVDSDQETLISEDSTQDFPPSAAGLILVRSVSSGEPSCYRRIGMYDGEVHRDNDNRCKLEELTLI